MKQMIKYTLVIAAMLLVTLGASAQTAQTANIIYKLDGTVQTTGSMPGSVNVDFTNGTITITPSEGNYITAEDLKVVKVIDGSHATTRDGEPGFNVALNITAKDANADPSTTTVYTFTKLEDTNYGLEVTADFHARKSVVNATVTVAEGPYTYNGSPIKPDVTVTLEGVDLTKGTDYNVVYEDNIDAGTGKIIILGIRKYMGQENSTYTINPKSISEVTITLTPESFTYNGENQKPTVTVKDGETNLELNKDYELTNEGGTNVGEYTVTVTGKGNYSGEVNKKFNITAATMEVTAEGYTGTYDGKAYGITVTAPEGATIKYGTVEGTYDLTTNPTYTNADTYTVYYCVSMANYNDVKGSKNVAINPKSIADATITLTPESFTYNSENQKPTVRVKDGETELELDKDYELTNEGGTNEGEYTVIVTGKGNYDAQTSANKKYNITAANMEVTAEGYTGTYDGKAYGITVTAPEGATIKYGTVDGNYDLTTNPTYTNADTYTVYYCVSMANYNDVKGSKNVAINPKSIADATITLTPESFTYNSENQKPTVRVKDGETELELDKDYELTNEGGTNVGEYTVTITGKGNYSEEVNKQYNITTAAMEVTAEGYTGTYDGKAYGITVTVPDGATIKYGTVEGTYDLTTNPTYTNAGTYTVYYRVTKENYEDVMGSKDVVINPKSIADVTITLTPESFTYNGESQKPTVSVKEGDTELVLDTDYTLTNEGGTNAGEYTVTATGKGNYDPQTTASKKFTINKGTVTLSYSAATANATMGEAFTAPTLTNTGQVAVTYSSSNTEVATISTEGVVELKGAGKTTITATFAGNDNQESASASYELTVAEQQNKQQNAGLSWTDEGAEYYLDDKDWWGPRLNNPNGLEVEYKSSDEKVATIDKNGVITPLRVGETWIMAIFKGNDEFEAQTVQYGLFVKERYNLLVNDVRVTSDNSKNILGDGHFFYDENTKQLVVLENTTPVAIESHLKNLTIFLNGSSKLERIFFNNEGKEENTGSLTITTYENIPGSVVLETSNANGVISGFSSLTIDDKSYTYLLDPAEGKYEGGKLVTAEGGVAMSATIGQYLKPLVDGQTVTFPPGKFGIDDFTNKVIDDILFTLLQRTGDSDEDDDYYDPVESAIVLNNLNSSNGVTMLIDNVEKDGLIPGSNEYALQFKGGITFMVPNGEGTITLNLKTEPGYKLMLMIGKSEPKEISQNERGDVQFTYNVEKATYCCIYLVQSASTRGTRIGKRDRHHGTIYSIKVEPTKVRNMNPLGEVEGYPGNQKPEVVVHSSTGIKEIKVEPTNETSGDDSWYDMQGRKIDKPTKAGIYIQNRKKIVIR